MAEPNPVDPTNPTTDSPGESPKLVALGERDAKAASPVASPTEPTRKRVSRGLFALVVGLLVLSLAGLYAQTRRASAQAEEIALLDGQVEGLEVQLSAANTQIATTEMKLGMVRASITDMYEQMGGLLELVSAGTYGLDESEAPEPR